MRSPVAGAQLAHGLLDVGRPWCAAGGEVVPRENHRPAGIQKLQLQAALVLIAVHRLLGRRPVVRAGVHTKAVGGGGGLPHQVVRRAAVVVAPEHCCKGAHRQREDQQHNGHAVQQPPPPDAPDFYLVLYLCGFGHCVHLPFLLRLYRGSFVPPAGGKAPFERSCQRS